MAMFLTIASLLEHLGETRSAALVRDAVRTVCRRSYVDVRPGESASTNEVAAAVIAEVARKA
jgi:isocitrate/isopropylmalate dehydrogenase